MQRQTMPPVVRGPMRKEVYPADRKDITKPRESSPKASKVNRAEISMPERQGYTKISKVCKIRRAKMIHTTTSQVSKGRGYDNSEMHQQTMRQFVRGPADGRRITATEAEQELEQKLTKCVWVENIPKSEMFE